MGHPLSFLARFAAARLGHGPCGQAEPEGGGQLEEPPGRLASHARDRPRAAVEPERLLEFRWGKYVLRCELVPDGDGCRFLFSEQIADASMGARNAAGWEWCLQNLETILEGAATAKFVLDLWRPRFEHYVAAFQPQFGPQQGPPETHSAVVAEKNDKDNRG